MGWHCVFNAIFFQLKRISRYFKIIFKVELSFFESTKRRRKFPYSQISLFRKPAKGMFLWEKTKQARKISHSKQKKDGLFLFRNQYSIFPLCHQSSLNETTISCSSFKMQEFNYAMMIIYIYIVLYQVSSTFVFPYVQDISKTQQSYFGIARKEKDTV